MNNRKHSQTVLFMTELILVLLFFSVAASVCLQVYVHAAGMTGQSDRKSEAVNAAENVIAALRAGEGTFSVLDETFPTEKTEEENSRRLVFDKNGNICSSEEGDWFLKVTVTGENEGIALVEMEAVQEEEVFYRFSHRLAMEAFYEA